MRLRARHPLRARRPSVMVQPSRTSGIANSRDPSPRSGSTPKMSSIQVGFNNVSRIKLVLRVANANSTHAKKRLLLNAVASLYQSVSARVAREGSEVEQLTRGHLVD